MVQFAVTGTAVIEKIKISSAAQKQLRNLVVKIDTTDITRQLNRISAQLLRAFAPLQKITSAGGGLNRVANGFRNIQNASKGANTQLKKSESLIFQVIRKASAFRVSTIAINSFFNTISNGLRFLVDFDDKLRNINKILRLNDADLTGFGDSLIQVAKDFNLSAEEVAEAARTAAQAGLAGPQATEQEKAAAALQLASKAAIAAASSTLDYAQAVESLLTVQKQLGVSTNEASVVLGKFAAIEDAAAVDAQALSVVFQKAGTSIGLAFGDSVDKATGAIAALLERTRQTPQVVGTFFKTLSARLSGANKDAIEAVRTAGTGINLTDAFGNLKDPIQLLTELRTQLKGLSDIEVGEVLGKVFGIRQAELGKALIATLGETGRATELAAAAQGSYLTQILKVEQEQDKFAAKLNRVLQGFNQFVNALRDNVFGPFIDGLSSVGEALTSVLGGVNNAASGIKALLGTVAAFGAGKVFKFLTAGGGGAGAGALSAFALGTPRTLGATLPQSAPPSGPFAGRIQQQGRGGLLGKATKNFGAFSAKAVLASASLSVLTQQSEALAQGQGAFLEGLTSAASSFSQALIFGPRIALLAGLFDITARSTKTVIESFRVAAGDLDATAKFLRDAGDTGGAQQIERQAAGRAIAQDAGGARGAQVAQQFSAIITDIRDRIRGETTDLLTGAEESSEALKVLDKAAKEAAFDGVARLKGASVGAVEALEGVQGGGSLLLNQQFLANFDKETAALVKNVSAAFARDQRGTTSQVAVIDVLREVARIQETNAQLVKAFEEGVTAQAEDTELVKRREAERDANQKLAQSIDSLLVSEVKLFAARGSTNLQAIQARTFLEEELARKSLDIAKAERERIKVNEVASIEERIKKTLQQLEAGRKLSNEQSLSVDLNNKVSESLRTLNDRLVSQRAELDRAKGSINSIEEVQRATVSVIGAEVALVAARLKGLDEIQKATELSSNKQIAAAKDITSAFLAVESAQQALDNFTQDADIGQVAAQRLERERQAQAIALNGIDEQIALQRRLQAEAATAREEVENVITKLQQELAATTTGTGQGELEDNLNEAKRNLEIRRKLEQDNNEKIKDLINQRTTTELRGRAKVLGAVLDVEKAEQRLADERLDGARALLNVSRNIKDSVKSIFQAQLGLSDAIRGKLEEAADAIKSRRGGLDQAFSELASARAALIDAASQGADAVAAYTVALNVANVAADKILGKFFGIRDQAAALAQAFDSAIEGARLAGASEQKLTELRQEAATQQLALFEQLLSDTQSKAERFFASSADERQDFVTGLSAIQAVVARFQGNIENFRALDEGALNEFGSSLIALPQDIRQNILGALDQLPSGVGIGGLTADEIKEVLLGGALGESEEVGIERLSDTMQTVADLTRQVAELNTAQLIAAQENKAELLAAVAEAREGVTIAKNLLSQAKQDAANLQRGISQVTATINSQIGQYRDEFKTEVAIITQTIDDPLQRQIAIQQKMADFLEQTASIIGGAGGQISSLQPDSQVIRDSVRLPAQVTGGPGGDVLRQMGQEIARANGELATQIDGLRQTITSDWTSSIGANTQATDELAQSIVRVAQEQAQRNVEASINIDNEQEIKITGVTEIVAGVMSAIEARGFVTPEQLQSIATTIDRMLREGVANGTFSSNSILN